MKKFFVKDAFVWGFILWLIGYLLGMVLFFVVPVHLLGWVIMPIGLALTSWVVLKKMRHSSELQYYFTISVIWTTIAVLFDFIFIVNLLHPEDGYYKFDVYMYYLFTFVLPLIGYWWHTRKNNSYRR